jgi:hypothetical protein
MLIDQIADAATEVLHGNKMLVSRLVSERKRYENWLQLEILKRLMVAGIDVDIERPFPESKERCDFWSIDSGGCEHWVEIKLCVTNYCSAYTSSLSSRPITNQISDILRDVEKLNRISSAYARNILLVTYPLPEGESEHPPWVNHLEKLQATTRSLTCRSRIVVSQSDQSAQISSYVLTV